MTISTAPETADRSQVRAHRRAETARLLQEAQSASEQARPGIEEEVIRLNMGVAGEIARRYHGRGIAVTTSTRWRTSAWSRPSGASTPATARTS